MANNNFFSADLNGNGKVGFGERLLGLDPGVRALAGAWRWATGSNQPQRGWGNGIQRQNFGLSQNQWGAPQEFRQNINPTGGINSNLGRLIAPTTTVNDLNNPINYNSGGIQQQPQSGMAPTINPMAPKPRPVQYPQRNGLDFMDTTGSAYQSLNAPLYQPSAMQANNGYFDMGKAGSVGGNWVQGAGWRTDANRAMGQSVEDMQFLAQQQAMLNGMYK